METLEIIKQIEQLPLDKRMLILERTLKSIREIEIKEKINWAVNELQAEYKANKDLTVFTDIDFVNFYETK